MRISHLAAMAAMATIAIPSAAAAQNGPTSSRTPAPAQRPVTTPPTVRPTQPAAQTLRPTAPQQSQIPQTAGLIILIKASLIALNQANQTGNYQVLYALGSDGLRARTNPQNLAQSFTAFRERRIDLNPVIFLNPQLSRQPAIESGRLHLVGSFPTNPLRLNFDFWFEPSQGQWKFVQLNTNLSPATAQAATPTPTAPQQKPAGQSRRAP